MMEEVKIAVMDKFKAHPGLKGALCDRLFFDHAPQYSDSPYGIFRIGPVTQEEIMGGADDNIKDISIQFSVLSAALDGGEELSILIDEVRACYDWQTLDVSGYNHMKMQPDIVQSLGCTNEVWQAEIFYSLGIQKE